MKKKLVYVAHPYDGKKSNKEKIDKIMQELVMVDITHDYVSPIHNYGFMYLTGDQYQFGLGICIGLSIIVMYWSCVMTGRLAEAVKANMNTQRNMALLHLC